MVQALTGWVFIGIIVPVLIGIGVGVLSMAPPEFTVAKACFSLAAFILLAKTAWWVAFDSATSATRERLIFCCVVFGLTGVLWAMAIIWVRSREPRQGKSGEEGASTADRHPFRILFAGSMSSPSTSTPNGFWVLHGGPGISPLSSMLSLQIANRQTRAAKISQLTIEAHIENGQWVKLARIDSVAIMGIYWVYQDNFKEAVNIKMEMLDSKMEGRALSPAETVDGWLLLVYPRMTPPQTFTGEYRVTVGDTLGAKHTEQFGKTGSGKEDFGSSSLIKVGKFDISGYPISQYQDNPNYWLH